MRPLQNPSVYDQQACDKISEMTLYSVITLTGFFPCFILSFMV